MSEATDKILAEFPSGRRFLTWKKAIVEMMAALPQDYERCQMLMGGNRRYLDACFAEILQPRLNSFIRRQPHNTLAEKKLLAERVNGDLDQLGITIRFPGTGRPAKLIAERGHDDAEEQGVFRLTSPDMRGKIMRSKPSPELFDLELMSNDPRTQGMYRWVYRVPNEEGRSR